MPSNYFKEHALITGSVFFIAFTCFSILVNHTLPNKANLQSTLDFHNKYFQRNQEIKVTCECPSRWKAWKGKTLLHKSRKENKMNIQKPETKQD